MPAIAISAVNTGTDTLTVTAHGLLTGDRFRVRNVGGALPTGLFPVTDYFAVRLTADTIKVATSSANALAGTPVVVDISGAGSGTTTVEYGLPFCIPTAVAAPGSQIKSADDNGTWAALVALYSLLTGQAQSIFAPLAMDLFETGGPAAERIRLQAPASLSANQTWTMPSALPGSGRAVIRIDSAGAWSFDRADEVCVSAAAGQLTSIGLASTATFDGNVWFLSTSGGGQGPVFNIPVASGYTLTALTAFGARGNATGGVTASYRVRNLTTGVVIAAGSATQSTGLTDFALAITSGLPVVIPAGHVLDVTTDNSGGAGSGNIVRGVRAVF